MYEDFNMATMRLDVTIPAQRLLSQAALLVDQYKPVVEEALKEAMIDMTDNSDLRLALKERIKQKLREKVTEAIDQEADSAIRQVMKSSSYDFYGVVNMPGFDIQDFFGECDYDPACHSQRGHCANNEAGAQHIFIHFPIPPENFALYTCVRTYSKRIVLLLFFCTLELRLQHVAK